MNKKTIDQSTVKTALKNKYDVENYNVDQLFAYKFESIGNSREDYIRLWEKLDDFELSIAYEYSGTEVYNLSSVDYSESFKTDIKKQLPIQTVLPPVFTSRIGNDEILFIYTGYIPLFVDTSEIDSDDYLPLSFESEGQVKSFDITWPATKNSGGGGAMRADDNGEVDYLWSTLFNKNIGMAIGLDESKYQFNVPEAFNPTNYPKPRFAKTPIGTIFDEQQQDSTYTKGNQGYNFDSNYLLSYFKKFKKYEEKDRKNKPSDPRHPKVPGIFSVGYFSKPTSPYGTEYLRKKQKRLDLLHKGGKRKDAKSTIRDFFKNTYFADDYGNNDYSASKFLTNLISSGYVSWPDVNNSDQLRTDQEWCHLYGHGDGGTEKFENFVSGSKHCNTEQLAIETGQRIGRKQGLEARITAYLVPNTGTMKKIDADKVKDLRSPKDLSKLFNDDGSPNKSIVEIYESIQNLSLSQERKKEILDHLIPFPVAKTMRYKIYHKLPNGRYQKLFDHQYDAQSESFNYHEFKILQYAVRRAISKALDNTDFDEFIQSKQPNINSSPPKTGKKRRR